MLVPHLTERYDQYSKRDYFKSESGFASMEKLFTKLDRGYTRRINSRLRFGKQADSLFDHFVIRKLEWNAISMTDFSAKSSQKWSLWTNQPKETSSGNVRRKCCHVSRKKYRCCVYIERYTSKGATVYAVMLDWPAKDGPVVLGSITWLRRDSPLRVRMLGVEGQAKVSV